MPKTRGEKRRATRQTKALLEMLFPVDMEFNRAILTVGEGGPQYENIYKHYLYIWQTVCHNAELMDIDIVEINKTYFAESYAPFDWTTDAVDHLTPVEFKK